MKGLQSINKERYIVVYGRVRMDIDYQCAIDPDSPLESVNTTCRKRNTPRLMNLCIGLSNSAVHQVNDGTPAHAATHIDLRRLVHSLTPCQTGLSVYGISTPLNRTFPWTIWSKASLALSRGNFSIMTLTSWTLANSIASSLSSA